MVALMLFWPAFTYAAESPSLTTYTVSHSTIYPSASGSGVATSTIIDVAFSEAVKVSMKIFSSGGELIKSLYTSSNVTNPTPKMWDGMTSANVRADNGTYVIVIAATSTASGAALYDSSKSVAIASPDSGATDEQPSADLSSDIPSEPAPSGGSPEYMPVPNLRILTAGNRIVTSGADTPFEATVYDARGTRRDDALVTWSFGDGMQRTGASVFHAFYEPGEYAVIVRAKTSDGGDITEEDIITAKDLSVRISSLSERGITLTNSSTRSVDLSLWRLTMGGREFKIPNDTLILPGHAVLFPMQIIQLPFAPSASLLYPSGEVAAVFPASAVPAPQAVQPPPIAASYTGRQKVEPLIRTQSNIRSYEEAVVAPAASTELAAAGASLAATDETLAKKAGSGMFSSPWAFGLLGVIAIAGGAFIFL